MPSPKIATQTDTYGSSRFRQDPGMAASTGEETFCPHTAYKALSAVVYKWSDERPDWVIPMYYYQKGFVHYVGG